MMNTMIIFTAVTAVVSYLIGSVNFSILISKAISGKDIRESGSGNAGATNMLRTHGKKMAIITLLLDVAKGVLVVILAYFAALLLLLKFTTLETVESGTSIINTSAVPDTLCQTLPYIAGLFVMLGHCFPIFFGFKGGKGVATALGVVMTLDWQVGIIVLVVALAIMAITRYVSLGSVVAAALFVILTFARMFFAGSMNIYTILCSALMGLLIILRHHANIKRLKNGTENKLSFSSKKEK